MIIWFYKKQIYALILTLFFRFCQGFSYLIYFSIKINFLDLFFVIP